MTCPPCTGNCSQGDECPARLAAEQDDPMEQFNGVGWRELFAATWPVWLVFAVGLGSWAWRTWA